MDALDSITPPPRLGDRVVVRYRLPDSSATDLVGWVEELDDAHILVRDAARDPVAVQRRSIVAARRLPAARVGRDPLRTSAEELEQIALPGWVAERQPLGEWTLRAGGGFTGRANSCLAVGDPGVPVADAAREISEFAAAHGIPARAQVVDGSSPEAGLRALGWTDCYVPTDVLTVRLNDLLAADPDPAVRLEETLGQAWVDAYHLSRPNSVDPQLLRRILESEGPRAFAGVPANGRLVAIGRGHVSADWLGIASVWTDPGWRQRGWATKVMVALGHWAARRGARNVYLQVAAENAAAHRAYARLGFVRHHGYGYLQPPA